MALVISNPNELNALSLSAYALSAASLTIAALSGSAPLGTLGVYFLSASNTVNGNGIVNPSGPANGRTKVIFSTLSYLTTSARLTSDPLSAFPLSALSSVPQAPFVTVTFATSAGVRVASGTGKLIISSSFYNQPLYIYDEPSRECFATKLLSGVSTLSLTALGPNGVSSSNSRRLHLLGYC